MKYIIIIFLSLIATASSAQSRKPRGEPKNIQVQIDTILNRTAYNIDARGLTMPDSAGIRDTVYIKWGSTRKQIRSVQVGTWFTIYACKCDPEGKWIMREIRLNR